MAAVDGMHNVMLEGDWAVDVVIVNLDHASRRVAPHIAPLRLTLDPAMASRGQLMILVAGPYRSGTNGDPELIQANVDAMTATSLELYRRGHLPVMGEWFALPADRGG